MNKTALLVTTLALFTGCANIVPQRPVATTPIPQEQFTAQASWKNEVGSAEIALEEAEKFCAHWGAKPGVLKTETIDKQASKNAGDAAHDAAKSVISAGRLFGSNNYQTTITYKCY